MQRTLHLLRMTAIPILLANFALVLIWPSEGIHQWAGEEDTSIIGAWRGFMLQKNFAGAYCAITILLFFFNDRRSERVLSWVVLVLAAIFLYKTQSKTSMGC